MLRPNDTTVKTGGYVILATTAHDARAIAVRLSGIIAYLDASATTCRKLKTT